MRGIEDRRCLNYGPEARAISSGSAINFEFHRGNGPKNRASHSRTALGKPTPSKWDDAQKWLVNLSRGGGERNRSKNNSRNSNADDRRLIAPPVLPSGEDHEGDGEENYGLFPGSSNSAQYLVETTKKVVDCDEEESIWRINKPSQLNPDSAVGSICVRDMGTEMTPNASQEPSRTGTPIRAARSPISSGSSTPIRTQNRVPQSCPSSRDYSQEAGSGRGSENKDLEQQAKKLDPLEARAMAWDEAERAKYMARFKREEVKIQAWENHEKRKAEMDMRRMEVKAERLKARARERLANKLAATSRISEEKRANAESRLNEKAIKTSERADYIRRTGHLPSSFSFKLPSFCW